MHLSNKVARIIFASAAVVLLALSYLVYRQIKDLLYVRQQFNETNIVKLKLEQTLSALKDAETAQRGFLLTKDSAFLQPYYGAYEKSKKLLDEIRTLTAGHNLQQKDLNTIRTLVEVRFKTFNQVIHHYNDPNINDATRKLHLLRGKSGMDSIRQYAAKVEQREDDQVLLREHDTSRYHFLTPFFGITLMVVMIGILIFSYGKIIEQLNRSRRLLITLRQLNRKLKTKNHQLEAYNKELDSFTYIASHDLKEPLRKIILFTALLESNEKAHLSEEGYRNIEKISRSATRMRNLLNDLLRYSQTNSENQSYEDVDLNQMIGEVRQNLDEEIQSAQAVIRSHKLPVIKGMPFQIKQLFENLITNSIQYRQPNIRPCITVTSRVVGRKDIPEHFDKTNERYYKIEITDNGIGFEQAFAEKAFQLFQRLHTKNGQPGTGIGLTICQKIVHNHNGFIHAKSQVNKGTTFEIYLPVM